MKTVILAVFSAIVLSSCSIGFQMESPFRRSDEAFSKKVAELVNPSLQQIQGKFKSLETKGKKK